MHRGAIRSILRSATAGGVLMATAALAHHTYAMFDYARRLTVSGTVAKFQWVNPHAYLWVYVPSRDNPGKYDLLAFENGGPAVLAKMGWSKEVLRANEKITVEYAPLRDGRPGGHCVTVVLPDGRSLVCPGPGALPGATR
jgi:hypothetical protein